jgi:hypothetical protein
MGLNYPRKLHRNEEPSGATWCGNVLQMGIEADEPKKIAVFFNRRHFSTFKWTVISLSMARFFPPNELN